MKGQVSFALVKLVLLPSHLETSPEGFAQGLRNTDAAFPCSLLPSWATLASSPKAVFCLLAPNIHSLHGTKIICRRHHHATEIHLNSFLQPKRSLFVSKHCYLVPPRTAQELTPAYSPTTDRSPRLPKLKRKETQSRA